MPFVNGRWVDYYPANPIQGGGQQQVQQTAPAQAVQPSGRGGQIQGTGAQRFTAVRVAPKPTPAQIFQSFMARVRALPANNPKLNMMPDIMGQLLQPTQGLPSPAPLKVETDPSASLRFLQQSGYRYDQLLDPLLNKTALAKFKNEDVPQQDLKVYADTPAGRAAEAAAKEAERVSAEQARARVEAEREAARERFYQSITGGDNQQTALDKAVDPVPNSVKRVFAEEHTQAQQRAQKRGGQKLNIGDLLKTVAIGSNPLTAPLAPKSPMGAIQNLLFPGASGLERSAVGGDIQGVIKNIPGAAVDVGTALIPGTGGAKIGATVAEKTGSSLLGKLAGAAGGAAAGSAINSGASLAYGQNPLKPILGNNPLTSPAVLGAGIGGVGGGLAARGAIIGRGAPKIVPSETPETIASKFDANLRETSKPYDYETMRNLFGTTPTMKDGKVLVYRMTSAPEKGIQPGDFVSVHDVSKLSPEEARKFGVDKIINNPNYKLVKQWIPQEHLYQTDAGTQHYVPNGIRSREQAPVTPGEPVPKVPSLGFGGTHETPPGKAITSRDKGLSGVIETARTSPNTRPELQQLLKPQPYDVLPNKVTLSNAVKEINQNPQKALNEVLSTAPRTADLNAKGLILAEKAQKKGDFDLAQSIFKAMAPGNTRAGQTIQVLSVWGKTTPEGVVKYAQKVTDDANNALKLGGKNPKITLTAEQASKFRATAKEIKKMPEGRDKLIATQKMLNDIHNLVPVSLGTKLQSSLYYAQLLNPKTAIRNLGGNFGFAALESGIKDVVGTPIDATITAFRKALGQDATRTTYLPNPIMQTRAGFGEARRAAQEIKAGVNLSALEGQLQIGRRPKAFKGKAGTFLERALQYELSTPDRLSFGAREAQTLKNLMRGAGVTKPTQEMRDIARADGMYATFQDDSNAARLFVGLKKALNAHKDFGVGSFVLNYPKTPGNLLARGIDYSPVGFVKATMNIGRPLFRRGPFDQKAFVDNFSRALVGTAGLVGTGAILHRVGIITGAASKDKDVNSLDKATGLGAYRINLSGLKRFILSGFDPKEAKLRPGDSLINYDWFQPAAIGISMGANIDETQATDKGAVGKFVKAVGSGGAALAGGVQTLAEQPLVTGVEKLTGAKSGGDISLGALSVAEGVPASFVPTLVSQINQLTNNTSRSTYDPNPIKQAINQAKAKIPGLSETLQPQVNSLGQNVERYQGGTNNWFNVFLNPGFMSKYKPTALTDELKRLQNSTNETKQFPWLVNYTQKVNGKTQQLTPEQITQLQRYVGTKANDLLSKIINSTNYQKATDDTKVNLLSSALTSISQAGRAVVLGDKTKLSKNAQGIASGEGVTVHQTVPKAPKTKKVRVARGSGRRRTSRKTVRASRGGRVARARKTRVAKKTVRVPSLRRSVRAAKKVSLTSILTPKKKKRTGVLASLGL